MWLIPALLIVAESGLFRSDQKLSAGGPEGPAGTGERRDDHGEHAEPRRLSEHLRPKESGNEAPPRGGADPGTDVCSLPNALVSCDDGFLAS